MVHFTVGFYSYPPNRQRDNPLGGLVHQAYSLEVKQIKIYYRSSSSTLLLYKLYRILKGFGRQSGERDLAISCQQRTEQNKTWHRCTLEFICGLVAMPELRSPSCRCVVAQSVAPIVDLSQMKMITVIIVAIVSKQLQPIIILLL